MSEIIFHQFIFNKIIVKMNLLTAFIFDGPRYPQIQNKVLVNIIQYLFVHKNYFVLDLYLVSMPFYQYLLLQNMDKKSVTLKFLIVGDSGVGKTSLLMRYSENKFHTDFLSTIGVDFKVKKIETDTHNIVLNIWDTAGQERFRNITKTFYKGAHAVILVYSIIDTKSFQHIASWIHQVKDNGSEMAKMMLVASKCDLEKDRQVTEKLGREVADKFNLPFVQTSAKDDVNVEKVFTDFAKNIVANMKQTPILTPREKGNKLSKIKSDKKKKENCC